MVLWFGVDMVAGQELLLDLSFDGQCLDMV
jgi:hypothetical protein